MQVKNLWVGDRPAGSWTFQVLDQRTGAVQPLTGFTSVKVLLLDPQNKMIEVADQFVAISSPSEGQVTFFWPNESLFKKPGRYVLQLELSSPTANRRTSVQEILVRQLGGVTN